MTRAATITRSADFALSDLTVQILEAEGTVQLVYRAGGWPAGVPAPIANQFCDAGTAGQLRVKADHLDTIDWQVRASGGRAGRTAGSAAMGVR